MKKQLSDLKEKLKTAFACVTEGVSVITATYPSGDGYKHGKFAADYVDTWLGSKGIGSGPKT